jgi:hypothetical protein
MPNGALRRYDEPALGAHADLDELACVHDLPCAQNSHAVVPA